jgi:hypothetical protein
MTPLSSSPISAMLPPVVVKSSQVGASVAVVGEPANVPVQVIVEPSATPAKNVVEINLSGAADMLKAAAGKENVVLPPEVRLTDLSAWPVRAGYSGENLIRGARDPADQFFSQGRTFVEVAQAARQSLDARLAAMKADPANGQVNLAGDNNPANRAPNAAATGSYMTDTFTAFGDLDRRALFAVASNEGGLFTDDEASAAHYTMIWQANLASGLDPRLSNSYGTTVGDEMWNKRAVPEAINRANFLMRIEGEEAQTRGVQFSLQIIDQQMALDSQFTLNGVLGLDEAASYDAMAALTGPIGFSKERQDKLLANMRGALESLKATSEQLDAYHEENAKAAAEAKSQTDRLSTNLAYFEKRATYALRDPNVFTWTPPAQQIEAPAPGGLINLAA